jgi:hypothetical protein
MPLTLDEIVDHEERLRREIVERECLLAAFKVLHGYAANGQGPKLLELGSLVSALAPSTPQNPLEERTASLPPAPAALPAVAPVPPYMHPELHAIGNRFGSNSKIVWWAIQRMTEDYSLHDIAALLEGEGRPMRSSEISVVLTRLKSRGEIEEVKRSSGPIPAVYRKPESVTPPETNSTEQTDAEQATTEPAVMA